MMNIRTILPLLLITSFSCSASEPTFLTNIINQWPHGKVTVKSTDPNSGWVVYKGTLFTDKQDEFNVTDITALNYFIPYEFSDTVDYSIIITVYDANNKVVSAAHLYEKQKRNRRSGAVQLAKKQGSVIPFSYRGNKPLKSVAIMVDKNGAISMAPLLTITFKNNTGVALEVGSPNCSLASSVDKIYLHVDNDPTKEHTITTLFNTNNCKIVATAMAASSQVPLGSQATICLTEQWMKTDQCKNCDLTTAGDYVCCHTDPLTDENVCNSEGIVWVRGNIIKTDAHVWIDYGIVPRKKPS